MRRAALLAQQQLRRSVAARESPPLLPRPRELHVWSSAQHAAAAVHAASSAPPHIAVASAYVPSVAEADGSGFGPVSAAVSLLEHVHVATGLPWRAFSRLLHPTAHC